MMKQMKRGLTPASAAALVKGARNNVSRMLGEFEAGRLAMGGAFEPEEVWLTVDRPSSAGG